MMMVSSWIRFALLAASLAGSTVGTAGAATQAEAFWHIIREGSFKLSNSIGGAVEGTGADPGVSRWRSLGNLERGYALMQERLRGGPVGIDFVEELHGRVTAGHASADPGKMRFRTGATVMASGTFQGADAAYAPAEVLRQRSADFDRMLRRATAGGLSREETIRAAATAQAEISRLHYFANGNGRMARMTADYIFMKNGFPPATHASENYLLNVSNKGWADYTRGHEKVVQHYERYYAEALRRSEQRLQTLLARNPGAWVRNLKNAGRVGAILGAAGIVGALGYDALNAMGLAPSLPGDRTGRGMVWDVARTVVPFTVGAVSIVGGILAYDHFRPQLPRIARFMPLGMIAAVVAGCWLAVGASKLMEPGSREATPASAAAAPAFADAALSPAAVPAGPPAPVAAASRRRDDTEDPLHADDLRVRD